MSDLIDGSTRGDYEPPLHKPADVRQSGRAVLLQFGLFLALGLIGGVLWWLVTPRPHYQLVAGQVSMDAIQVMKQVNADMWFAVISAGLGIFAGVVVALRRASGPMGSVLFLIAGASLAALLMWQMGELLTPDHLREQAKLLKPGQALQVPLRLEAKVVLLVWPVSSLCAVGSLLWLRTAPAKRHDED
jgi:hypothetical protein